ncbi:dihydrolipoamide acetyltransferase family protein [Desmospora activa]|uniref:Dihydrolipoamide acetyltransferase component of pyruvate dehydrogenase complex n=1 Tax=Desmospora activa DSM 45169 TaxID=1121389 RepID=A0A2T4Z0M2_9BACL|nr:dihydrolipoamide acetyltransferase family protein [Desmospora activa]PTM53286.1 pyruvate dehydrogenase E2 component (dihydrolipoamide acetyltransferase) [Desmospora activa DSM 45169]
MAQAIWMPKLGMTMEKGTILQWFKEAGDPVEEGEPILEVMTDKINIEVEAYTSGTLLRILHGPDEEVAVNEVIGYIGEEGEVVPEGRPSKQDELELESSVSKLRQNSSALPRKEGFSGAKGASVTTPKSTVAVPEAPLSGLETIRATPSARRTARKLGVFLHEVTGSGRKGRIHREDVEVYATRKSMDKPSLSREISQKSQGEIIPYRGMRETVGRRMAESAFSAPHVTLFTDVDMGAAIETRQQLLEVVEQQTGYRLSHTELILKACAFALKQHPEVNASLQGKEILRHSHIHLGLAVAVEEGLLVPVIRDANRKGLAQLTQECKELAQAAREKTLTPDQLSGSTFTISNLGMYEVDGFTPIINQPESAILGVGRIKEKPVGVDGEIKLRPIATFSLSFDHRVLDGAPAARFLQTVKQTLEQPEILLV